MATYDDHKGVAPRRTRWGRPSLLLLLGILVVGGVLVWQVSARAGNRQVVSSHPPPATGHYAPLTPPLPLTAMYDGIVKEQVAHGLHLTISQVTEQLQAQPSPDLRAVGKQQGLAQDQLYAVVLNALLAADDRMVSSGVWTHQQATRVSQYWKQQDQLSLINGVANWFVQPE